MAASSCHLYGRICGTPATLSGKVATNATVPGPRPARTPQQPGQGLTLQHLQSRRPAGHDVRIRSHRRKAVEDEADPSLFQEREVLDQAPAQLARGGACPSLLVAVVSDGVSQEGPASCKGLEQLGALTGQRLLDLAKSLPSAHSRRLGGDADVLDLEVLLDAFEATLTPEAGMLNPTERRRRVGHDALVDADHPELQRLADPHRA